MRDRGVRGASTWALVAVAVLLGAGAVSTFDLRAGLLPRSTSVPDLEPGGAIPAGPTRSVLSSAAVPALGTPTWTNLTPGGVAPAPRISGGLVYDAFDGYTVLFGGEYFNTTRSAFQYYNDTWKFANGVWTNLTASPSPSPRFGFGLAYDPAVEGLLLFGGRNAAGNDLNDSWAFSAGKWTNLSLGHAPTPRYWLSMTWDGTDNAVLLFGGYTGVATENNETWEYTGSGWGQLHPASSPSARHGSGLIGDAADHDVVLFGGLFLNDTWTFASGTWSQLPNGSLDERVGAGFAYDSFDQVGVLYGGNPANTYPYGTWVYSAGAWTLDNLLPNVPIYGTVWDQFTYDAADGWTLYLVPNTQELYAFNFTSGAGSPFTVTPTVAPLSGTTPLVVNASVFATGGTAPYNFTWSFGTGPTQYGADASATYTSGGVYTVTLNAHDAGSGSYVHAWTVNVTNGPLAVSIAAVPTSPAVGTVVTFSSLPSGGFPPYAYSWAFGDGGTAATRNATHVYSATGTYAVELAVTDANATEVTANLSLTVHAPPHLVVQASLTPVTGVAPLPVVAAASASGGVSPYHFAWTFGDGGTASGPSATYTYDVPGTWSAHLYTNDSASGTTETNWSVVVYPPLSLAISASTGAGVAPALVAFTATPTGGVAPIAYLWNFDDGTTSVQQNPDHTFDAAGTYNVTVTGSDAVGQIAVQNVTVSILPGSATGAPGSNATGLSLPAVLAITGVIVLILVVLAIVLLWGRRRRKVPPPTELAPPSG